MGKLFFSKFSLHICLFLFFSISFHVNFIILKHLLQSTHSVLRMTVLSCLIFLLQCCKFLFMLFCFILCHLERYFLKLKYFNSRFLFSYNNFVRMFLLSIFVHFEMSCISKAIDTKCLYGNWGEGLCYVTLSLTLKASVLVC